MKKILIGTTLVISLALFLYGLSDTKISAYLPKNSEEKDIGRLLGRFMETWNKRDIEGFLSVFHPEARYMMDPDRMVSKSEMATQLPDVWHKGCPDCITWECINEHCYEKAVILNPKITLDQDRAKVMLTVQAGFYRGKLYLDLIKENQNWSIIQLTRPLN